MTESEIKSTLSQLGPSIRDIGAEQALLKYAKAERLAPAQLERLAQVCNVSMMLDHSKRAAPEERGQEVDIIDIPALLDSYADTTPTKRAAARVAPAQGGHSVGAHFWGAEETKQAADPAPVVPMTAQDILNGQHAIRHNIESVRTLKQAAMQVVHSAVSTMCAKIAQRRDQIPELLVDIQLMSKQATKLEDYARKHLTVGLGYLVQTSDIEKVAAKKTFTVDHIKVAHLIDQADAAIEDAAACDIVIAELEQELKQAAGPNLDRINKQQKGRNTIPVDDENAAAETPLSYQTEAGGGSGGAGGPPTAGSATAEEEFDSALDRVSGRANLEKELGLLDPGAARVVATPTPIPDSKVPSFREEGANMLVGGAELGANTFATGATGIRDIVRELFNSNPDEAAAGVASGYRQIMDPDGQARTGRISKQMLDMKQRVTLARLLNSDPVLAKQDPRVVMQIFESLRARSPNLAADISAARPILREASQYAGIPLSSMKTMQELERPPAAPRP